MCQQTFKYGIRRSVAAEGNLGVGDHHLSAQVKGLREFERRPCVNSNDSCYRMGGESGEVGLKFCNTEVDGFSEPLRRYILSRV